MPSLKTKELSPTRDVIRSVCRQISLSFSRTWLIHTKRLSVLSAQAYNAFLSSSQRLVLQNGIVEMQTDARAAMDFMVRELRLAFGTPTITTTVTPND